MATCTKLANANKQTLTVANQVRVPSLSLYLSVLLLMLLLLLLLLLRVSRSNCLFVCLSVPLATLIVGKILMKFSNCLLHGRFAQQNDSHLLLTLLPYDGETERQSYKETDRQTYREADRQSYKETDRQLEEASNCFTCLGTWIELELQLSLLLFSLSLSSHSWQIIYHWAELNTRA